MLVGGIKFGRFGKLTCDTLARALGLKGGLIAVTHKVKKMRGNEDTFDSTIALTTEEAEKHLYNEIRVEPLEPSRSDEIFADLSR